MGKFDVFLSYAREDEEDARRLREEPEGGGHHITATYLGDTTRGGSTSTPLYEPALDCDGIGYTSVTR